MRLPTHFFPIYSELGIDERSVYYSSNNYVAQSSQQGFEEISSFVTLHETGHALGLKHPHHPTDWGFDGQSINPYTIGSSDPYGSGLSSLSTVMSYYNKTGLSVSPQTYWSVTPMPLDVEVLQYLYGAPQSWITQGDTSYGVISENTYQTFYDDDGRNELDFSAAKSGWMAQLGHGSSAEPISAFQQGSSFPYQQVVFGIGNFSDAVGSEYGDTIISASSGSRLDLRGGNDFALSTSNGANADEFDGGAGSDTVALLGDISDYRITNNWDGGINFIDGNGNRVLTATDFEFYRFNYNADGYTERSQDELQDFINDSPGRIDVSFSGLLEEDQILSVDASFFDPDGVAATSLQWSMQKDTTNGWVDINGATENYLVLTQDHVGATVRVGASYIDDLGNSTTVWSSPDTSTAVANINDDPIGEPQLAGEAQIGASLYADTSSITDEDGLGDFNLQWQLSDDQVTWFDLGGETGESLLIQDAYAFHSARAIVSYTDAYGTFESLTSASTAFIDPSNYNPEGKPLIVGDATEDKRLTADTSQITDADGIGDFDFQWQQKEPTGWVAIQGAK